MPRIRNRAREESLLRDLIRVNAPCRIELTPQLEASLRQRLSEDSALFTGVSLKVVRVHQQGETVVQTLDLSDPSGVSPK